MQTAKKMCARGGTLRYRFPSRQLAHRAVNKRKDARGVYRCKTCGGFHTKRR